MINGENIPVLQKTRSEKLFKITTYMINYKIQGKQKPGTDEPQYLKYYACIVSPGVINMEGLAKRISTMCTVTRADCLAVLAALQQEIVYALQSGMKVHMGDVGSFRLSCQSEGAATAKEFEVKNIKKLKVIYNPSKVLRNAIQLDNEDINFYNLEKSVQTETEEDGQEEGGV